mmetsp:Transcript_3225/g.10920  ORF Transcript_3225/g.10920 Transcript_3225/m.10920 type:complete len:213 (+) Transcript_3225:1950-2588(+)
MKSSLLFLLAFRGFRLDPHFLVFLVLSSLLDVLQLLFGFLGSLIFDIICPFDPFLFCLRLHLLFLLDRLVQQRLVVLDLNSLSSVDARPPFLSLHESFPLLGVFPQHFQLLLLLLELCKQLLGLVSVLLVLILPSPDDFFSSHLHPAEGEVFRLLLRLLPLPFLFGHRRGDWHEAFGLLVLLLLFLLLLLGFFSFSFPAFGSLAPSLLSLGL